MDEASAKAPMSSSSRKTGKKKKKKKNGRERPGKLVPRAAPPRRYINEN